MKRELRVLFPLIFVILLMFLVGCSSGAMDRPPVTTETETDPGLADLPSTQFPIPLPTDPPPDPTSGPISHFNSAWDGRTAAADTDSVRRGEVYRT